MWTLPPRVRGTPSEEEEPVRIESESVTTRWSTLMSHVLHISAPSSSYDSHVCVSQRRDGDGVEDWDAGGHEGGHRAPSTYAADTHTGQPTAIQRYSDTPHARPRGNGSP